jgi:myo-inositol-1(or 4)-monophosphatase
MTKAELDFAVQFAKDAGCYMVTERQRAITSRKLDRTVVTNVDKRINRDFIGAAKARFGSNTSVIGEEESARATGSMVWVIDPVDGTGEYVDTTLADSERTSCIGIALFKDGGLKLSVVYNPFRNELFVADRQFSGTLLGGQQIRLGSGMTVLKKGMAYDYCHWDGCSVDVRFLEELLGAPRNSYSAISQACDVARGKSAFAIFPGNTIHDIAPGALLVELAGGVVTDVYGRPLQWSNLGSGAVYAANPHIHKSVIWELRARL